MVHSQQSTGVRWTRGVPENELLGNPTVIPGVGVTHLRYTVHKA